MSKEIKISAKYSTKEKVKKVKIGTGDDVKIKEVKIIEAIIEGNPYVDNYDGEKAELKKVETYRNEFGAVARTEGAKIAGELLKKNKKVDRAIVKVPAGVSSREKITVIGNREVSQYDRDTKTVKKVPGVGFKVESAVDPKSGAKSIKEAKAAFLEALSK